MSIIGVKDLNKKIETILTTQKDLKNIKVEGEISGFKISGNHAYFKIKEDKYTLNCVFFWYTSKFMKFLPKDGMKVICEGDISTYYQSGRSDYNLKCINIEEDGEGKCRREYDELINKLKKEGLFDIKRKKKIPKYPKQIGLVTAYNSHAYNDLCQVGKNRYKGVKFVVSDCKVQGIEAPKSIIKALDILENDYNTEVIILARGGGSFEDLHCFNDEHLARYISSMKTPIITGIGHQPDTTIADLVADLQASTPTDAISYVVINVNDEKRDLSNIYNNIFNNYTNMIYNLHKNNNNIINYVNMFNLDNIISDNKNILCCEVNNILSSLENKLIYENQKLKKEKNSVDRLDFNNTILNYKLNINLLSNNIDDNLKLLLKNKDKSLYALNTTYIENTILNQISNNKKQIKNITHTIQDNTYNKILNLKKYISINMNVDILSKNIISTHHYNINKLDIENSISNLKYKFSDFKIKNYNLNTEINHSFKNILHRNKKENTDLLEYIINLGPDKTLKRGYSIILNNKGEIITNSSSLHNGIFDIKLADETIKVYIQKVD
ncbi:MAG: exodeoxyribonuclease VII large subunit [Clostridium sp.]|nr:exodeoxyribonuclease VII large subunit [Clostridium sp.]